jgi:flavodoxin I
MSIGLFYGSTNGNTASVAVLIRAEFAHQAQIEVDLLDVAEYYVQEMADFDYLILGIPTWNVGQLQRDWDAIIEEFDTVNLQGKRAALFGLGDQVGYPATFGDGVFFLADKLESCGARIVGRWPTDGYSFTASWAVRDGQFIGLMIDEDNQRERTEERVHAWVGQLVREFGIVP